MTRGECCYSNTPTPQYSPLLTSGETELWENVVIESRLGGHLFLNNLVHAN